jgi:hypothetical protein
MDEKPFSGLDEYMLRRPEGFVRRLFQGWAAYSEGLRSDLLLHEALQYHKLRDDLLNARASIAVSRKHSSPGRCVEVLQMLSMVKHS